MLPDSIEQKVVSRRGTDAIFEVSFFTSEEERQRYSHDFPVKLDEKVSTLVEEGCRVAGFHVDTTITKVLVEVIETGSQKNDAGWYRDPIDKRIGYGL